MSELVTPVAIRLEKSVLSCLIQNEYVEGEESLTPEHFYPHNHRKIYELIISNPRPTDLTGMTQKLLQEGELEALGGPATITEIYTYSPTSAHFKTHIKELHTFKARRLALRAALDLSGYACDLTDDEAFLRAATAPMQEVVDVAANAQKRKLKPDTLKDVMSRYEKLVTGAASPMGWSTGISELDESLLGIHPQRLYIIAGYPTSGKTVLTVQIIWNLALNDLPTLFISLEMPSHKIAERNLIIASRLPAMAITKPLEFAKLRGLDRPCKHTLIAVQNGYKLLEEKPIYWEDPTSPSLEQLCATIRSYVRNHGVRVVAIDYLQLVRGGNSKEGKEQEVATISHTLQGLAKELNIAIILLSQLNKEGGTKYATATQEDADHIVAIMQNRDSDSDDFGKHQGLGINKDRHDGNTGDFLPVVFDKELLKFTNKYNLPNESSSTR